MCLEAEIREYLEDLAISLGLRSADDFKTLNAMAGSWDVVKLRVPRRFKRGLLLKRVKGGYRLTGLGALIVDIATSRNTYLHLLSEGVSIKGGCSKDLLAASLIATALALDLRRLHEAYGDSLPRILAEKAVQAIGLGAMIYILAPPLSGGEAHSIIARIAGLLGLNPLAVEECKSILWKAITRSSREEEAELMELMEKAITKVNRDIITTLTETLGDITDYACTIAKEERRKVECNELEEAIEKLLGILGEYLRR